LRLSEWLLNKAAAATATTGNNKSELLYDVCQLCQHFTEAKKAHASVCECSGNRVLFDKTASVYFI